MTRISTKLGAAFAAAFVLAAAAVPAANANYLGYGNGDPGNWDFWTEQNGGKPMTMAEAPAPHAHAIRHAAHQARHQRSQDVAHADSKVKHT